MMALEKTKDLLGHSLTCEEVNQIIVDYLEGNLSPRRKALFEQHISRCQCCGPYLEQYRATIDMIKESGEAVPPPPEALVEETMLFLNKQFDAF